MSIPRLRDLPLTGEIAVQADGPGYPSRGASGRNAKAQRCSLEQHVYAESRQEHISWLRQTTCFGHDEILAEDPARVGVI